MKLQFKTILLISKIYLLLLGIFTIFRFVLFFIGLDHISFSEEPNLNVFRAFVMGVRFDLVIIGYVLFFPAFILLLLDIFKSKNPLIRKIIFYWIFIFFSLSFMISAADIPYFNQFFSRFNVGAFAWADSPIFVLKMVLQEPKYFIYIFLAIALDFIFYKALRSLFKQDYSDSKLNISLKIVLSLVVLALMFAGIRGRLEKKSPIRVGTAYFCTNPFLNQLGLNPSYTLLRSYLDSRKEKNKPIDLMDEKQAIKNVQKYLGINKPSQNNPISREIHSDSNAIIKPNVVLVIMESMSAAKMGRFGNSDNLTPFLDSLTYQSYFFNNIYSDGEHTFNGIFSSLFSLPSLYRRHTLKQIKKHKGIAYTLQKLGYSTTYFTTHDSQFDNVEGFLRANNFENIISQADYPSEEIKTTLGVPDDYLFRYSIPVLDKMTQSGKPFFAAFMTASDHGPYYVPEYFKSKSTEVRKQSVEYADWSIKQFIKLASEKEWFDNTIFIFVADHGAAIDVHYDISLNYHHSPLLFFAPKILKPQLFENIGGQIDIYPTLMGILNQTYTNTTLGVDLLKEGRPYIFINGDDKVAVLDKEFLFILKKEGDKKLYKYSTFDTKNYLKERPKKAQEMEEYVKSNLQTFQYILLNSK